MVDQPGHAESAQFLIKEFHSELAWMVTINKINDDQYDLNGNQIKFIRPPLLNRWHLPARSGIYSMMASRTLHLVSSASSTMAGNKDWNIDVRVRMSNTRNMINKKHRENTLMLVSNFFQKWPYDSCLFVAFFWWFCICCSLEMHQISTSVQIFITS